MASFRTKRLMLARRLTRDRHVCVYMLAKIGVEFGVKRVPLWVVVGLWLALSALGVVARSL